MRNSVALLVMLSLSHAVTAVGQKPPAASQQQDILTYPLTMPRANHLITAMQAMTQYLVSLPDYQDRVVRSMQMTPAEQRAQMEKDPKPMAILKQSRDVIASPANVAFAKAHLAELKPKMDAADGLVRPKQPPQARHPHRVRR